MARRALVLASLFALCACTARGPSPPTAAHGSHVAGTLDAGLDEIHSGDFQA